ncbi:hypothetical protein BpHYR1_044776, partial [Brachionus plicatilis]
VLNSFHCFSLLLCVCLSLDLVRGITQTVLSLRLLIFQKTACLPVNSWPLLFSLRERKCPQKSPEHFMVTLMAPESGAQTKLVPNRECLYWTLVPSEKNKENKLNTVSFLKKLRERGYRAKRLTLYSNHNYYSSAFKLLIPQNTTDIKDQRN